MPTIRTAFAALAFTSAIAISGSALADTFTLANDNGGDGYSVPFGSGVDLFGADNNVGDNYTTYTATALSDQLISISWIYHTDDTDPSYDPAGYVINGVFSQLTNSVGPNDQSGSFLVNVLTGDIYGIYVYSTDSLFGRGDLAVTPSETPVPAALPLFATGLGAFGLVGWRWKRKATAVLAAA